MKIITKFVSLFITSIALMQAGSMAAHAPYKETILGKICSQKTYQGTELIISDTYDEKPDSAGFLLYHNFSTENGTDYKGSIIYHEMQGNKIKEHQYNMDVGSYLYNSRNCIAGNGDTGYLCKVKQKKKKVSVVIHIFKNGSRKQKKEISLSSLITEDIKKQPFYFKSNRIYILNKNKIRLLYSIDKPGLPRDNTYFGGYADINLKTGTVKEGTKVEFSPEVLENGYLCGVNCYTEEYTYDPYAEKYYMIGDAKTGKTVQKISTNYGVQKSKFINPAEANEFQKYEGLPEGETTYTFHYTHDWQDGKLLFANVSGIYYASADKDEVRHLLDYCDMPYYGGEKNKRYLHSITLKNESEFYALYGNNLFGETAADEYIVHYQAS